MFFSPHVVERFFARVTDAVVWSTIIASSCRAWMAPLVPVRTSSTSRSLPTQVKTKSAPCAADEGVSCIVPRYALIHFLDLLLVRLKT